ncbi:TPA: DUF3440 domain-containing protein [Enterococcus faecalis]|nr:DUF3440 domain-containing protein [Enterococcus faecalis]
MKEYKKENVLDAAITRLTYIFENFQHVYFSFSGGKDSGAMIQLANVVAKKLNRKFDLFILDVEANYDSTRFFIEKIKKLESIKATYHFCLPFYEDNTTSIFQPQWLMWDDAAKEQWIQPLPKDAITIDKLDKNLFALYRSSNMNPDKFLKKFIHWYYYSNDEETVACGIGIRSQESLNRYKAITSSKFNYDEKCWIKHQYSKQIHAVNFCPIYDWSLQDVWGAYAKYDWYVNEFYEKMYKVGVPLSQMRICQPYGLQQRKGLEQYAFVEPNTWERVVNRVSGANFGRLYSRTSLLSHYKSRKPDHMSWQEYTVFLLESIGLYSNKMRDHYYRKLSILMEYYKKNFNVDIDDIPEEATKKEWQNDEKLWHNWKDIARAIEKNDFALSTRQYSLTKIDEEELYELAIEYGNNLGIENLPYFQLRKIEKKLKHLM